MNVCVSVDVERDWRGNDTYGVIEGIPKLLKLFKKYKIKTTFFVTAELLLEYHNVIKKIKKEGHEIASHGLFHEKYSKLTEQQTLSVMNHTKRLFKKYGFVVKGFRAPFLITNKYFYKTLKSCGFEYDSSKTNFWFPTRYNYLGTSQNPHKLSNGLMEIPISNMPLIRLPLSLSILKDNWESSKDLVLSLKNKFVMIYLHPYEVINQRPKNMPKLLRSTANVTGDQALSVLEKLIVLLKEKDVKFVRCQDLLFKPLCNVSYLSWVSHDGCPKRFSCKDINSKKCKNNLEAFSKK